MQILFIHPNYPAQFGPMLQRLSKRDDVDCVFVTKNVSGIRDGVRCIKYETKGGATKDTHYCSRTFENAVWHAHGVYETCETQADLKPDLIVGHSGFGTTVFLSELYESPIINLFEFYYRPHGSDLDFRPDFPTQKINYLRSHTRNAMILLDLETCAAGYAPTAWQWSLLPDLWQPKVEVIHDGIDMNFWRRRDIARRIGNEDIPENTRIVTYVSRGLESMRGFDIFVRVANRIAAEMPNVLFVVVGADKTHYGNDLNHIQAKTFREHVLLKEKPDLSRFRFLGVISREQLADIFSLSDLHIFLTVPFVLSWSVLNAMACECVIVGSDTPPVLEVIRDGDNGLLANFFDVDGLAAHALRVLKAPQDYRALGERARALIQERYSLDVTFPKMWSLFKRALAAPPASKNFSSQ
ncbi:MAG TPA: glycosyltransferase [Terriglobia bacterium]|nr:glycosyltransferase [Terriglobia bacterium]